MSYYQIETNPMFLWIAASVAAAAAVNVNDIKTLLTNGFNTFFIMVSLRFSLKAIQFLVMVLKVYQEILLIVLFYVIEFLIVLY